MQYILYIIYIICMNFKFITYVRCVPSIYHFIYDTLYRTVYNIVGHESYIIHILISTINTVTFSPLSTGRKKPRNEMKKMRRQGAIRFTTQNREPRLILIVNVTSGYGSLQQAQYLTCRLAVMESTAHSWFVEMQQTVFAKLCSVQVCTCVYVCICVQVCQLILYVC